TRRRPALSGSRRRQRGRRRRLFRATETLPGAFAQLLERDVEHRHQEDPDRACGKHAAEYGGTDGTPAELRSTGGDDQRQQTENEGDRGHHHSAEPHLRTEYRRVANRDAALTLLLGDLDNQDAISGGQRDQAHEPDLT